MTDPDDPLTDDALTGRYRVFQRKRGHRYSLDDVLTAYVAAQVSRETPQHLDLGCGIGSVLLMAHDVLSPARSVGVEAQEISFALLEKNLARNELSARVEVVRGDLRDEALRAGLGRFDLITGTPPYMPVGTSTPSPDSQRAHARVELRGGIEAYVDAAVACAAEDAFIVLCGDARTPERIRSQAHAKGLTLVSRTDAIPRAGRDPLFSVWVARKAQRGAETARPDQAAERVEAFVARKADGTRTDDYYRVRAFFGLPRTH